MTPEMIVVNLLKLHVYGHTSQTRTSKRFPVYWATFGMVTSERTNKQLGDPRASLLLTSEKAVCCNIHALIH